MLTSIKFFVLCFMYTFLEVTSESASSNSTEESGFKQETLPAGSGSEGSWSYISISLRNILIVVGALVILAIGVFLYRYRRSERKKTGARGGMRYSRLRNVVNEQPHNAEADFEEEETSIYEKQ